MHVHASVVVLCDLTAARRRRVSQAMWSNLLRAVQICARRSETSDESERRSRRSPESKLTDELLRRAWRVLKVESCASLTGKRFTLQAPGAGEQRAAQRGASSLSHQGAAGPHRGVPLQPGRRPVAQGVCRRQRLSRHPARRLQQVGRWRNECGSNRRGSGMY